MDLSEEVLKNIRKIMRAVDLHSRQLEHNYDLTGSQAIILSEIGKQGRVTTGGLSKHVSLSNPTVTGVVNRLEKKGLVIRVRSQKDKRRTWVHLTDKGKAYLEKTPPLLQERFLQRFDQLKDWEQTQILYILQRVASMMNAEELDAAPLLTSGEIKI